MFSMHSEIDLILMMAAEKSQGQSTKSNIFTLTVPTTFYFSLKLVGPLNVYNIHEKRSQ